jgi:hypothetical protein
MISADELWGGFPFVDPSFNPSRLLAAVSCVRVTAETLEADRQKTLTIPELADTIQPHGRWFAQQEIPEVITCCRDVSSGEMRAINEALSSIVTACPDWKALTLLPIRFMAMPDNEMISASLPDYPQHILLSASAFVTSHELREQILHELAHNWLYLVVCLSPIVTSQTRHFKLPSGTEYDKPLFLLGAAHVTCTLLLYYRRTKPSNPTRLSELATYLNGCLETLANNDDILTEQGRALTERIGAKF